jgi:dTDP-4-dehydrorhamnose 3,5-epimerase
MEIYNTRFKGLIIIQPKVFEDERGYFLEWFREDILKSYGINAKFVQDNEAKSQKNVLRGLHFQNPPFEQGKLIRVVRGSVLDVAVDIRKSSETYGQWFSREISDKNKSLLWIPPGFAHGYLTLEENTIFQYKCTGYYNKDSEDSIRWNDPVLNIDWEINNPIVSEKDRNAPLFNELESMFE